MNILIVINDASYGSEKAYNALRFIQGVELSNMKEFAQWIVKATKVLTF